MCNVQVLCIEYEHFSSDWCHYSLLLATDVRIATDMSQHSVQGGIKSTFPALHTSHGIRMARNNDAFRGPVSSIYHHIISHSQTQDQSAVVTNLNGTVNFPKCYFQINHIRVICCCSVITQRTALIEGNQTDAHLFCLRLALPEFLVILSGLMSPLAKLPLRHVLVDLGERLFQFGQILMTRVYLAEVDGKQFPQGVTPGPGRLSRLD